MSEWNREISRNPGRRVAESEAAAAIANRRHSLAFRPRSSCHRYAAANASPAPTGLVLNTCGGAAYKNFPSLIKTAPVLPNVSAVCGANANRPDVTGPRVNWKNSSMLGLINEGYADRPALSTAPAASIAVTFLRMRA